MNKIFCLETEWDKSIQDLKKKSAAKSLLEFIENTMNIPYAFRQVATSQDFEYYINHLNYSSYSAYDMVYLCFHGAKSAIEFANGVNLNLRTFANKHENLFLNRNVHFGSCSSLRMKEEEIKAFKRHTNARMITGYTRDVDFMNSFVFELWLLSTIAAHPNYTAKGVMTRAVLEMPSHVKKFGFVAY
ncbi:MAG: hypothetical protein J6Z01_07245 [Bacteroidales bacterium]|nr:hypothetical protein [Bacteroidales bacterium]